MRAKIMSFAVLLINASLCAAEPMIVAHRGASRDAPENTVPGSQVIDRDMG